MGTTENLQTAFAGESQANRKYLAFARKAEADGYHQIAKLLRAAAEAETVHAMNHFRALKGVKSTAENIQASIEGEGYEFREMYPKFLAEAEAEGNKQAIATFKFALAVETLHHALYTQALNALNVGGDLPAAPIFICQVCGNTVIGEAPDECPICRAKKDRFTEMP
jgi:rubrerythrin